MEKRSRFQVYLLLSIFLAAFALAGEAVVRLRGVSLPAMPAATTKDGATGAMLLIGPTSPKPSRTKGMAVPASTVSGRR